MREQDRTPPGPLVHAFNDMLEECVNALHARETIMAKGMPGFNIYYVNSAQEKQEKGIIRVSSVLEIPKYERK